MTRSRVSKAAHRLFRQRRRSALGQAFRTVARRIAADVAAVLRLEEQAQQRARTAIDLPIPSAAGSAQGGLLFDRRIRGRQRQDRPRWFSPRN